MEQVNITITVKSPTLIANSSTAGFISVKQLVVCTLRQGDSAVYTYIFITHSYLLPYGLC